MIYLTKNFPPKAGFKFKQSLRDYEYSFIDKYGNQIIYLIFNISEDGVLMIKNFSKCSHIQDEYYFSNEHFGTELLNASLLDLYMKWEFIPSKITGRLSSADAEYRWEKSISFYYHFHDYIDSRIPYSLSFRIFSDKERTKEIHLNEDIYIITSELSEICAKKKIDLYFQYDILRN